MELESTGKIMTREELEAALAEQQECRGNCATVCDDCAMEMADFYADHLWGE